MSDEKEKIVINILLDYKVIEWSKVDSAAREIVSALTRFLNNDKWSYQRLGLLHAAQDCWIPERNLVAHLNALPGAPLSLGDLKVKCNEEFTWPRAGLNRFPEIKKACLEMYERELKDGTSFEAICDLIQDHFVANAENERQKKEEKERAKKKRELAKSGSDFGFMQVPGHNGSYKRYLGQLFRLDWIEPHKFVLFRVNNFKDKGVSTNSIFKDSNEANKAVRVMMMGKANEIVKSE